MAAGGDGEAAAGSRLIVKGLPPEADDAALRRAFAAKVGPPRPSFPPPSPNLPPSPSPGAAQGLPAG